MSKVRDIKREDILKAIEIINSNPELRKKRSSSTYDLIYNNNMYPPILVLSEANKLKGGEELLLSDFGNSTELPFKILHDLGFNIVMKRKSQFKEFLENQFPEGSGAISSYLQAMDNLGELLNQSGQLKGSIYGIEDVQFFNKLLEEVKIYQKDISSILYSKPKSYADRGFYSASLSKYIEMLSGGVKKVVRKEKTIVRDKDQEYFTIKAFTDSLEKSNLYFDPVLVTRFVTSLVTKPFVLLNGLSGSGKTKLAQAFVQWICQEETQYRIIPVGADWTNREPLLGYPDGLNATMYVTPDNGALQLMLDAQSNPNLPFFMILDEMNLSHVERYFADFLSVMESNDSIKLYTGDVRICSEGRGIPQTIQWPNNLFIIGTVNIDETTYMFSPKVLDRANVIEFRLDVSDLGKYFSLPNGVKFTELKCEGKRMSKGFLTMSEKVTKTSDKVVQEELLKFFTELSKVGAEFGYRTANEVLKLINQLSYLDYPEIYQKEGVKKKDIINYRIDIAIMQKLLPKLHGSRSKIVKVLETLVELCLINAKDFDIIQGEQNIDNIKYPISYAKLMRMYHNVIANGFTSYAEA
ncbi:hypothetical protein GJV76_11885 [Myroides sp. BIT-d1]|uniref:ATPase dynein-related AAA domain-containing protein n=1 Tax=Myroides albus TaxID=2562892 RepID=A0A6I3LRU5_9FLAO|nr:hypothetical protein [Myroides albus]MTG98822.1 hypothetical protein [Myroides albus]